MAVANLISAPCNSHLDMDHIMGDPTNPVLSWAELLHAQSVIRELVELHKTSKLCQDVTFQDCIEDLYAIKAPKKSFGLVSDMFSDGMKLALKIRHHLETQPILRLREVYSRSSDSFGAASAKFIEGKQIALRLQQFMDKKSGTGPDNRAAAVSGYYQLPLPQPTYHAPSPATVETLNHIVQVSNNCVSYCGEYRTPPNPTYPRTR